VLGTVDAQGVGWVSAKRVTQHRVIMLGGVGLRPSA